VEVQNFIGKVFDGVKSLGKGQLVKLQLLEKSSQHQNCDWMTHVNQLSKKVQLVKNQKKKTYTLFVIEIVFEQFHF
jgi:hypothetical protein